jgi:hypothetical protein
MAKKDQLEKKRQKAREVAKKDLKERRGFPVAPRKAMSNAKKASKRLDYPLPPYAGANFLQLYRWGSEEWRKLGRWQGLAVPVVLLTALLTWEKEKAIQEDYYVRLEQQAIRQENAKLYGTFGRAPKQRKLLGIIPLPGGRD